MDFASILVGLGWVWGGFWEGFGRTWRVEIVVFLDRVFGFRVLVADAFGWVWGGFWEGFGRT